MSPIFHAYCSAQKMMVDGAFISPAVLNNLYLGKEKICTKQFGDGLLQVEEIFGTRLKYMIV